jgi:hypothetical protein
MVIAPPQKTNPLPPSANAQPLPQLPYTLCYIYIEMIDIELTPDKGEATL